MSISSPPNAPASSELMKRVWATYCDDGNIMASLERVVALVLAEAGSAITEKEDAMMEKIALQEIALDSLAISLNEERATIADLRERLAKMQL